MAIAFLNNITFSGGSQAEKLRLENASTNPSNPNEGQLYFNTSDDVVKVYANGAWVEVGGGVESLTAGTYLTNAGTAAAVVLNHDATTRTNTTSVTSPAYGGTFTAVDSVTTNATGHVSAVNLKTVTFPAAEDYTWTAAADTGGNRIIQSGNTIDFTGGTNINTANVSGETRFHLDDSITLAGTLTVNGTGQSSFGGQVTVPTTPSAGTDAASKSYVDSLVSGGLTFKGGFNAGTGAIDGGGNLTTGASRVAVAIGDYYVVTTAGSFYGSVALDVGDSVIAKLAAAQGTSDINDWVIVQGDEGVTTFSNSNGGTYVAYGTTNSGAIGAVDIGDVDLTAVDGTSDTTTRFLSKDNTWDVPSYTASGASGKKIVLNSALAYVSKADAGGIRTFTVDVSNAAVFGSGSTAINVKCEVITAAGQTVYADITRSSANLNVAFIGTPADSAYEVLLAYVG
jgi:hypothetical protein